ncbi:hypothetical protein WJX84_005468 [Apatococcus fuscideae]|uniref:Uncharacterized protein n=1 Tax=Apatococcus fuscideae TaxID=2026836 RepID=A0AAW1TF20_9CHLO
MSALKAWRRVVRYLQQDLREILVPTSLPDPPGYTPARKLGWKERVEVVQEATQDYVDSWKALRSEPGDDSQVADKEPEAPIKDELAAVARGGAKSIQPYLQKMYQTRASAYRDAVQEFVKGYREGYAADAESQQQVSKQQQQQQPPDKSPGIDLR